MNENYTEQTQKRIVYLDVLRVVAAAAVMLTHVSLQNWYKASVFSKEWVIYNSFDSISKWAVPVFAMISGSLFLQKDIGIRQLCTKYIKRIVIAFLFWSAIYSAVNYYRGMGIYETICGFFTGYYHMWYLYMIIGLYLITPFLRWMVQKESFIEYFLGLGFVFGIVLPQIVKLTAAFSPMVSDSLDSILSDFHFHFAIGYSFYFVLGYYLHIKEPERKVRTIIYVLGIFSFFSTAFFSTALSKYLGEPNGILFDKFSLNVCFQSVFVFVFFRCRDYGNNKNRKLLGLLSRYSFGAYLVHALIIGILHMVLHLSTDSFNPLLSIPTIEMIVFVSSFIVSAIINKIPCIGKYVT